MTQSLKSSQELFQNHLVFGPKKSGKSSLIEKLLVLRQHELVVDVKFLGYLSIEDQTFSRPTIIVLDDWNSLGNYHLIKLLKQQGQKRFVFWIVTPSWGMLPQQFLKMCRVVLLCHASTRNLGHQVAWSHEPLDLSLEKQYDFQRWVENDDSETGPSLFLFNASI